MEGRYLLKSRLYLLYRTWANTLPVPFGFSLMVSVMPWSTGVWRDSYAGSLGLVWVQTPGVTRNS